MTFDISQPSVRRHSSPASGARRRDSVQAAGIPAACTEYQLHGGSDDIGDVVRPRGSPEFRSASIPAVVACSSISMLSSENGFKISGRDSTANGNIYVNRYSISDCQTLHVVQIK